MRVIATAAAPMPTIRVWLRPSPRREKKWRAEIDLGGPGGRLRRVDFGAAGYSDYTQHKDRARWQRYKRRHAARENWGRSGIATPGFWSRWILWNKPGLGASIRDAARRFRLRIVRGRPPARLS